MYTLTISLDFSLEAANFEAAQQILSECLLSGQIQIKDLPDYIHRGDISGSLIEIREEESADA